MCDVEMEFSCIVDGGCSRAALSLLQAAAIHYEKVARREIGAFTTPKTKNRAKPLTPPASGKEPEKSYNRVSISYSTLDSIGHSFFQVSRTLNWKQFEFTHFSLLSIRDYGFIAYCYPPECSAEMCYSIIFVPCSFSPKQVTEQQPRKRAGTTDSIQSTASNDIPVYGDKVLTFPLIAIFWSRLNNQDCKHSCLKQYHRHNRELMKRFIQLSYLSVEYWATASSRLA